MKKFSLHTHTNYCDGKASIQCFVDKAISLDMSAIGFSSHAPLNIDVEWAMDSEDVDLYKKEILYLKKKHESVIDIFLSLEIDYVPGFTREFSYWKNKYQLDYTIGSIHIVKAENNLMWFLDGPLSNYDNGIVNIFKGNAQKAVEAYYSQLTSMIETQKPDVVAHLDKIVMNNKGRFFSSKEKWYINLLDKLIPVLKRNNTIVEINTRGIYTKKCNYTFPSDDFILKCIAADIPLTISTDAHTPEQLLSEFENTRNLLLNLLCKNIFCFSKGTWEKIIL